MAWPNLTDGSIMEVVVPASLDSQSIYLVLHYKYSENAGAALTVSDVAGDMDTILNGALSLLDVYSAALSSDATVATNYWIQAIAPTRYARISFLNTHAASGPAGSLPPGNAITITKRSTGSGRHSHGSTHVGAVPASYITDGILNGTEGTVYTDLATQLGGSLPLGLGPQSCDPVIFRRASPLTSEVINSTVVMPEARTMRRRVVGRGI